MRGFVFAAALLSMCGLSSVANAQFSSNSFVARNSSQRFTSNNIQSGVIRGALPRNSFGSANSGILKGAMGSQATPQKAKPFSSVKRGPSQSPYMGMLSQTPFTSSTSNYFNIVKPQLDAQRAEQRAQDRQKAALMQHQQQLTEVASKGPYSTTGSEERAPTGHVATYMNNGGVYGNHAGYYPQVPIKSVRGGQQQQGR